MKIYFQTLLAALGIPAVSAFVLVPPLSSSSSSCTVQKSSGWQLPMADDNDAFDEDFFSDYDPSKYESSKPAVADSNYQYDNNDNGAPRRSSGRGGGGRGGSGGRGRGGRGGGRGRGGGGRGRGPKAYLGPNGHDYQLSSDSGPNNSKLDEETIHALLAERLQAKFARDFRTADDIQMELIDGGVFVHDGLKEWRPDGMPYGSFHGDGGGGGRRPIESQQYSKSEHSPDVEGEVSDELITKLVKERTKFKMMREYSKADAVREGLRTKFNVLIDDRLKEWSVGGDFGEEHNAQREMADKFANRGYIKSTSSLTLDDEEEEYIQHHVDARIAAKKDRNFETADKIRLDLAQRFDVTINDKMKLWSIGGLFEEMGEKMGRPRGVYARRGGGDLSEEDVAAISKMISDRYHAKKQRDFDAADELRDELYRQYRVKIDDRSNEWRVDTNEYAMAGNNALSEEEKTFIDNKLRERFELKILYKYEDADAIRDGLKEKFGVQVDDRTKEWFVDAQLMVGAAEAASEDDDEVGTVTEEEDIALVA